MNIVVTYEDAADLAAQLATFLERAADAERGFAHVAACGKRRIAESLYAASCIERLALTLREMTFVQKEAL
jgi:hypothetical protein